jgi:4-oxalocrotonate tautomerase
MRDTWLTGLGVSVAKIHVLEGRYEGARLNKVSKAVQGALMSALGVPPDDFFQIIHVLPRSLFRHTPDDHAL